MQNQVKNLDANLRADIQRHVEVFTELYKSRETPGKPHGWVTEPCGGCGRRGYVFGRVAVLFSNNKKRIVFCALCKNCTETLEKKRPGNRLYERVQANLRAFGLSDSIETKSVSLGLIGGDAGGTA